MLNIFSYEMSESIYKLIALSLVIIGLIVSICSFSYELKTIGKEENEKKRIAKRYKLLLFLLMLFAIIAIVLEIFQPFNINNDVFNGEYLYVGSVLKGKAEGQGTKYFNDGCKIYSGQFKANEFSGRGEYYNTVDKETGEICAYDEHEHDKQDQSDKQITYIRYEGEFKNGLYNGIGKTYFTGIEYDPDNPLLEYEGGFKDNKYDGEGKLYCVFAKKDKKAGNIEMDEESDNDADMDSHVTYLQYEGEFVDGQYNGKGKLYYANLTFNPDSPAIMYEGEFKNGSCDGQGTYHYVNGDKYEGEFKNGKREGQGTFYYVNSDRYEGEFKDDKCEGQGTYYRENGEIYKGEFEDDKCEGQGIYYFADGSIYEGEFKDNQIGGYGVLSENVEGDSYRYEGEFTSNMFNGKIKIYINNQLRFEGYYKNNVKDGEWIEYNEDGTISYEGMYYNGEKAE